MIRDLRKYAKQTNVRLFIGFFAILLVVGEGLIYWFYGKYAALMGLTGIGLCVSPLILIGLAMWGIELMVKKSRGGEE